MTTKSENKNQKKGKKVEFDFGIGKLSLGGIFGGIEKIVDLAERAERAGGELKREGIIKGFGGRKDVRGVYGFTIRTGIGKGKSHIETFGNITKSKGRPGMKVEEVREPLVDVFYEKEHVLVVAELPGIAEKDIKIEFKDDILVLRAGSGERKYAKEVHITVPVDSEPKETKFHNGILELKFKKPSVSKK